MWNFYCIIPGILIGIIYALFTGNDKTKITNDIVEIIKGHYTENSYSNNNGKKLQVEGIEKNELGYILYIKLPVGFNIEKLADLDIILDEYNTKDYVHFVEKIDLGTKNKFNNSYLKIDIINKSKLTDMSKEREMKEIKNEDDLFIH